MRRLFCIVFLVLITSCSTNNGDDKDVCGDEVIIDEQLFLQDSPSDFVISYAEIVNNCISIEIQSSGCDAHTWQTDLITDGLETNSIPPARLLRLKLTNNEVCAAWITMVFNFDLGNENQQVVYSLEGWTEELIFN